MNLSTPAFVGIVLGFGILIYAILRVAELAFLEVSRKGKARIIWWDEDAADVRITFEERRGNEVTAGKGNDARTYILEADARKSGRYPTWLVHPRHGWCFRAPSDREALADKRSVLLSISNPAAYHRAIMKNEARDAMEANDESDRHSWVVPVATIACVALLGILGTVGWIAYRVAGGGA